jgi:hypothetical protein
MPQACNFKSARWDYYHRLFSTYFSARRSNLTFWYDPPQLNSRFKKSALGEYYMNFPQKADYPLEDACPVPRLNYRGKIGLQFNPIAIAQYGLGNYNLFRQTGDARRKTNCLNAADWLVDHLEINKHGLAVWNHHFRWEYKTPLMPPWYSALSQGQGISLLVRAYQETANEKYSTAADRAYESLLKPVEDGGVSCRDECGHVWIEEYLVTPPTHILNGFMWASWGVYDLYLLTGRSDRGRFFDELTDTLAAHLLNYDCGFWSLYEQSGTRLKMLASPFYHKLHIVQLEIMHALTGRRILIETAERWARYDRNFLNRVLALGGKALFKLFHY